MRRDRSADNRIVKEALQEFMDNVNWAIYVISAHFTVYTERSLHYHVNYTMKTSLVNTREFLLLSLDSTVKQVNF